MRSRSTGVRTVRGWFARSRGVATVGVVGGAQLGRSDIARHGPVRAEHTNRAKEINIRPSADLPEQRKND